MSILVIVESPAKCKKIQSYLGDRYKCIASVGHLTTINDLSNIVFENKEVKVNYTIIPEKQKTVNILQKEIANSSEVILATDDDREGESIAWHICLLFGLSVTETKRLIFHEITKEAIMTSINNMRSINISYVRSQQTRQILDILVGFKYSPILWKYITSNYKDGLSVGRCQIPALKIIYENAQEISKSSEVETNTIFGYFTKHKIKFQLNKTITDHNDVVSFLNLSKDFNHVISRKSERICKIMSPRPFSTSLLQQKSNTILGFSPKDTMTHAQKLYENGLITYMRTDNSTYSNSFYSSVTKLINDKYGDKYVSTDLNLISSDEKAHEAIRPTSISVEPNNLGIQDLQPKTRKLYNLIWKNSIQSLMSSCEEKALPLIIQAPINYIYEYTSRMTIFDGWKILDDIEKKDDTYNYLNLIQDNSLICYQEIKSKPSFLNKKSHLCYSTLIKTMEDKGFGRPSTYANIVDKIVSRGYISQGNIPGREVSCRTLTLVDNTITDIIENLTVGSEKNRLILQPLGFIVHDFVFNNFPSFFDYDFTKYMENQLDLIRQEKEDWSKTCIQYKNDIDRTIADINFYSGFKFSYQIDSVHNIVVGKYGVVVRNDKNEFFKIKHDISMFKLIDKEYTVDDIIAENVRKNDTYLGKFENKNMYVKEGTYGKYLTWGKNTKSLKSFDGDIENMTDVINFITNVSNNTVVRDINENCSIRNGKYGKYIFYKTNKMKKPQFLKLYGFPYIDSIDNCDKDTIQQWIEKTYKIYM